MYLHGAISYQGPWRPDEFDLALNGFKELDIRLCGFVHAQSNGANLGVESVVYQCHIYDMVPK